RPARRARRALVWRGRSHYCGRSTRAGDGRRGVSPTDLRRAPRGAAGAAAAAGGPWESRHATAIHLRRADLQLGAGAQTARPVRGRRTPLGRMRRRAGPVVNTVDSRHPPLFSMHIVYSTFYCMQLLLSCFEVFSGKSGLLLNVMAHAARPAVLGANHREQETVQNWGPSGQSTACTHRLWCGAAARTMVCCLWDTAPVLRPPA